MGTGDGPRTLSGRQAKFIYSGDLNPVPEVIHTTNPTTPRSDKDLQLQGHDCGGGSHGPAVPDGPASDVEV